MISSVNSDRPGVSPWTHPFAAGLPRRQANFPTPQKHEQSIRPKDLAWNQAMREMGLTPGSTQADPS